MDSEAILTAQRLRSTARTWIWFILGGTLLGLGVAFGLGLLTPPMHTARVTLLVSPTPRDTGYTSDDIAAAQAIAPTFAELATTKPVLERVIASTDIPVDVANLAEAVTTHVPVGTSLLEISVTDRDASNASRLANALASELRAYSAPSGTDANPGLQEVLTVVDPATPPTVADGPSLPVKVALGGAIGLFLTLSIAFLIENIRPEGRAIPRRPTFPVAESESASLRPNSVGPTDNPDSARPRTRTTTSDDPFDSGAAPKARIASRGVINDLEMEKIRRGQ